MRDPVKDPVAREIDDLAFSFGTYARVHSWQKKQREGLLGAFLHRSDPVAKTCYEYHESLKEAFGSRSGEQDAEARSQMTEIIGRLGADTQALRAKVNRAFFFMPSQAALKEDVAKFESFSRRASRILTLMK